jgi:pimeloyl-ACP methyl ester carboxylesterase
MRRLGIAAALLLATGAFAPPLLRSLGLTGPDRALLPAPGRSLAVAPGVELNVVEEGEGSGPPVVLIHGLPSNIGDWAGVPARLAGLGDRVVAYDRAGFGLSSRPAADAGRYTFESNVQDLSRLLEALGLERPVLVGWSYGGGIAQRFAVEHPDQVRGLVLLSSVGPLPTGGGSPLDTLISLSFGPALLEWIASVPPLGRAMTRDGVANAFSGEAAIPAGWVERTEAMLALPGTLRSLVLEMRRYRPADLQPEAIEAPVLILHGSADRDTPLAEGKALHERIAGSTLEVVQGGSHMLPATHTALVAERIHDFAARLP